MTNISTQGITANTCFCTGSICGGARRCCSHMVRPRMIGNTPSAIIAGGVHGISPNRLSGVSGSGADRSLIHRTNGWWRISIDTISDLYSA